MSFIIFPKNKIPIRTIFKIIGAADAAANLLCELSIAEKKDAKYTKIKKRKCYSCQRSCEFYPLISPTKPGAIKLTKKGINISASKTKKNKLINNKLKISLAN